MKKIVDKVRRPGTYRGNKQNIRNDGRHIFFMLQRSMQGHQVPLQLIYIVTYLLLHFVSMEQQLGP